MNVFLFCHCSIHLTDYFCLNISGHTNKLIIWNRKLKSESNTSGLSLSVLTSTHTAVNSTSRNETERVKAGQREIILRKTATSLPRKLIVSLCVCVCVYVCESRTLM